jgi:hypothetical protein
MVDASFEGETDVLRSNFGGDPLSFDLNEVLELFRLLAFESSFRLEQPAESFLSTFSHLVFICASFSSN